MLLLLMTGCSTSALKSRYQIDQENFARSISEYTQSVTDEKGKLSVPDNIYFNDLLRIAINYKQSQAEIVFRMMRLEADKKRLGYANEYDNLKHRFDSGDPSLTSYANGYVLNLNAQAKCESFGYKDGTADFNKCVHEIKIQMIQLMLQQQAILQQQLAALVWIIPPPQQQINLQTNCMNTYSGVQCQTTGH